MYSTVHFFICSEIKDNSNEIYTSLEDTQLCYLMMQLGCIHGAPTNF